MTEGPLGGPRPFSKDNKTILVLLGIDGPEPPNDIQLNLQESVNQTINQALNNAGANIKLTRQTVNLTVEPNPTNEQRNVVGQNALHVQQYGIETELEEISQTLINRIHNTVVENVSDLGFNIVGTQTTVS